jgi:hypothetical protein
MADGRKKQIDDPIPAYERMAERWALIRDLLGGTLAMRKAGDTWLPREDAEEDPQYQARLGRTILYEGLKDSIDKLAAKPLSRPISVQECPEPLAYLEDDVDRSGRSLTQLGRELFEDLAAFGKCHVLVDFSRIEQNEAGEAVASIADEQALGARAVFARVSPVDLFGWRADRDDAGERYLSQIRIKECAEVPDGDWDVKEVERVRVITPDSWELWEKVEDGGDQPWRREARGTHTFGSVFLVTAHASRTGYLESEPPLEGLAWLNLAHWQSMSDQRNILRFSRFGLLFYKGVKRAEAEEGLVIGPSRVISTASVDADLKYVEHSGKAIEAGRQDLEDLERRMEVLGLQPLVQKASATATEKNIGEGRNLTAIQAWIRALERALVQCYEMAARWHGTELPEAFSLDVYSDFAVTLFGDKDLDLLLKTYVAGGLTLETLLSEMKRRGKLADSVDPEEEAEKARTEEGIDEDLDEDEPPADDDREPSAEAA